MRMALETLATQQAMERCNQAELAELVEKVSGLIADMDTQLRTRNLRRVHQINLHIHLALYQMSKLPRVVELIQSMWVAYAFNIISMNSDIPYLIGQHHHELLDALKANDAVAVVAIIRDDLEQVHRTVMATQSFQEDAPGITGATQNTQAL